MKFTSILTGLLLVALSSLAQSDARLLEKLMQQKPEQFGKILANPKEYRLQIYTLKLIEIKTMFPILKNSLTT